MDGGGRQGAVGVWEGSVILLVAERGNEVQRGQSKRENWEGCSKGTFTCFVVLCGTKRTSSESSIWWGVVTHFQLRTLRRVVR